MVSYYLLVPREISSTVTSTTSSEDDDSAADGASGAAIAAGRAKGRATGGFESAKLTDDEGEEVAIVCRMI